MIRNQKNYMTVSDICKDSPQFKEFGKLVYALDFSEKPNYNHLRFLLQKNIMDMDIAPCFKINFNGIESKITNNRVESISMESTNMDPMESHDAREGI